MAGQEEGWPLGLQPLNVRVGLVRNRHLSGSISFNTLLTGSPTSSTASSSDLDTQSTGSFFHDKSITLGSLIGVSSILEFSRRSIRGRKTEPSKDKKSTKSRIWFFSLCLRDSSSTDDARRGNNASSLGHFLAVERRAADDYRRNLENPSVIGPDELALAQPFAEPNSLFVDGRVAPPQTGSDMERGKDNGFGVPLLCSCMCGQPSE
ncbi:uncharacterized protein At3g17950-like [Corylus avellana]|uniref:uncharacterized protein At3g17950-like n=1 Tax=Corylus avellana TaxID=13451 RepID=UPI001E1F2C18|nr:uncharacterized protein At3g17950-like [Corylus avellana]